MSNSITTPSISTGAMLAELNISTWAGRKKDKRASKQVTIDNKAKDGAANVIKSLLVDCQELINIHNLTGDVRRNTHYHLTMPWSDSGWRLLTTDAYFDYNKTMTGVQNDFYAMVDTFIAAYDWEKTLAQLKLGDMFDPNEYPSAEDLRGKFSFTINYMPVPDTGDWRVDINNEAKAELEKHYTDFSERQIQKALNDVWERLYEKLVNLSERLDFTENEKKKIFKESTVSNVTDMIDILAMCNVTNDPLMTKTQDDLSRAMRGITPEALREDAHLRAETKRKLDAAIKQLPTLN